MREYAYLFRLRVCCWGESSLLTVFAWGIHSKYWQIALANTYTSILLLYIPKPHTVYSKSPLARAHTGRQMRLRSKKEGITSRIHPFRRT